MSLANEADNSSDGSHARMNPGAFPMRWLDNVRAAFSLTRLAYNISRAITLVGVPGLIAAVRG